MDFASARYMTPVVNFINLCICTESCRFQSFLVSKSCTQHSTGERHIQIHTFAIFVFSWCVFCLHWTESFFVFRFLLLAFILVFSCMAYCFWILLRCFTYMHHKIVNAIYQLCTNLLNTTANTPLRIWEEGKCPNSKLYIFTFMCSRHCTFLRMSSCNVFGVCFQEKVRAERFHFAQSLTFEYTLSHISRNVKSVHFVAFREKGTKKNNKWKVARWPSHSPSSLRLVWRLCMLHVNDVSIFIFLSIWCENRTNSYTLSNHMYASIVDKIDGDSFDDKKKMHFISHSKVKRAHCRIFAVNADYSVSKHLHIDNESSWVMAAIIQYKLQDHFFHFGAR